MTNTAPTANTISASSEENSSILVQADFSDPDASDTHTFGVDTTGTLGSVTNNGDGTFSYDPNGQFEHLAAGETATDTFTYTVDDGNGGTSAETVTVTITGQNDAPVAVALTGTAQEDGPSITLTVNYSDPDASDMHTFSVDTTSTLGSVNNNGDGTFSYHPNGQFEHLAVGETATDTFTYTVDDGNGGTSTETVTVTITGQNDAPVAVALTGTAPEDGPSITLTVNYSDPDASNTHTFSVDTTGTLGSVTNNGDGTFSYHPNGQFEHLAAGETATDTFTYTVDDGNGGTSTETVTVTITGQNDAPVAAALTGTAQEDGPSITLTANYSDPDASDMHTFSVDTTGTLGSVTNNGDGTFSYHPNGQFEHLIPGETATDTFTYTVDDGNGGTSTETVTVTIEGQVEPAKLTASNGLASDYFGFASVVNNKGVVLSGARLDDDHLNNSGSLYLYRPDDQGGYSELQLISFDRGTNAQLGYSVALNDAGVAVSGAFQYGGTGAVYVFRPDGLGGYFETKLTASDATTHDQFGISVALNEAGVIAVGAQGDDDNGSASGSVYVYIPDGFGGYAEVKLVAPDGGTSDLFGASVSVSEAGLILVGATNGDGQATDSGSVYVYAPDGTGGYNMLSEVTAQDAATGDLFGVAASINTAGTIVVGAPGAEDGALSPSGALNAGAIYVYQPDGNGGYTQTRIVPLDRYTEDQFGLSVDINDNGVIVAGAHGNDDAGSNSGSAYVFVPNSSGGYTQYKLTAPDAAAGDAFGYSVSINKDGVVSIGTHLGDGNSANTGAVYTFVPNENGDYVSHDGTVYQGTASDSLRIIGSTANNSLSGGVSHDVMHGLAGNDTLTGNAGDDILTGGTGSDTFVFKTGDTGHDTITDFDAGAGSEDVLSFEIGLIADFASVLAAATDVGADVVITIDAGTSIELQGVQTSQLHQDDFQFV